MTTTEERKENIIARFFREALSEIRKVVWPSAEETRRLTIVVIAISLAVGLILFGFDTIFETIVRIIQ